VNDWIDHQDWADHQDRLGDELADRQQPTIADLPFGDWKIGDQVFRLLPNPRRLVRRGNLRSDGRFQVGGRTWGHRHHQWHAAPLDLLDDPTATWWHAGRGWVPRSAAIDFRRSTRT
jgi:hypothetical protein